MVLPRSGLPHSTLFCHHHYHHHHHRTDPHSHALADYVYSWRRPLQSLWAPMRPLPTRMPSARWHLRCQPLPSVVTCWLWMPWPTMRCRQAPPCLAPRSVGGAGSHHSSHPFPHAATLHSLSRRAPQVIYFEHNDMEDLERVLKSVVKRHKAAAKSQRRFIVIEGL